MSNSTQDQQQPDEWTESDYTSALAHLQTLQAQLNNLRTTIPSLITHFTPPSQPPSTTTPIALYHSFASSTRQAALDIQAFRRTWGEERSVNAFGMASESLLKKEEVEWEFVRMGRRDDGSGSSLEGVEEGTEAMSLGLQGVNAGHGNGNGRD